MCYNYCGLPVAVQLRGVLMSLKFYWAPDIQNSVSPELQVFVS